MTDDSAIMPIYRAVMLEVERRRLELGIGMERLSEIAGIADRAYPKMLYPEARNGRQARWNTLQSIVDTLFPDGFDVEIKPRKGPLLDALSIKYRIALAQAIPDRRNQREWMRRLGRVGGRNRWKKVTKEQHKAIARRAIRARWRRHRREKRRVAAAAIGKTSDMVI